MKIVKVRTKKNYAEASNHVLIGEIVEFNKVFIRVKCRSFHYKYVTLTKDQVTEGSVDDRLVPWQNVECVNVLDASFDWEHAVLTKCTDGICLKDDKEISTLISRYRMTHQ